jgi:hypothetical protein
MREYSFSYCGSTYASQISSSYSSGSISLSFFFLVLRSYSIIRRFWVSWAFLPPRKKGSSPSSLVHLAPIPRVSFGRFFILLSSELLLEDELELDEELPSESELEDDVPLELSLELDFFLFFFVAGAPPGFFYGVFFGVAFFFLSLSEPDELELDDSLAAFFAFPSSFFFLSGDDDDPELLDDFLPPPPTFFLSGFPPPYIALGGACSSFFLSFAF